MRPGSFDDRLSAYVYSFALPPFLVNDNDCASTSWRRGKILTKRRLFSHASWIVARVWENLSQEEERDVNGERNFRAGIWKEREKSAPTKLANFSSSRTYFSEKGDLASLSLLFFLPPHSLLLLLLLRNYKHSIIAARSSRTWGSDMIGNFRTIGFAILKWDYRAKFARLSDNLFKAHTRSAGSICRPYVHMQRTRASW